MELLPLLHLVDETLPEAEKQKRLQQLEQHINHLINHDFNALVHALYTVDVDERKLKTLLHQHPGHDAAPLLAQLLWARAEEKARTRRQFPKPPPHDDEEQW